MEEILNNLRQNPSSFYFLIIFALLWGGGILWGIVFVIRQLGKRNRSISGLKHLGFSLCNTKMEIMHQIKDISMKTLWHDFSSRVDEHPRRELIRTAINNGKISITYEIPKQEYRTLSRATGLKEQIQVVKRQMILSKILFRPGGGGAFYAQTNDTETIRAFKPRTRVRSTTGWALCFADRNAHVSTFTVYRKFSGHRKFLMNMALRLMQIRPMDIKGLLPEFREEFDVMSADKPSLQSPLSKQLQQLILKYKAYIPEGIKLLVNREGVWMTGEEWLNREQMEQVVKLCNELLQILKKEREI